MSTLALLMFNRNEGSGIRANVRALDAVVDEALLVDSSDPEEFQRLNSDLGSTKVRVLRAFPMGCTEPLRQWALRHVAADRVLSLDSDEEAAPELIRAVRTLDSADGYFLPRREESLGAYSYQLRLHRRGFLAYRGTIHEAPRINGRTERLLPPLEIVHHADYRDYLGAARRGEGYLLIEAYERPFTPRHLRQEYRGFLARAVLGTGDAAISPAQAWLLIASHRLRRYNPLNGLRGDFLTGKYLARYVRARFEWFRAMSESERRLAVAVAGEIESAGGVVKYLGLDRPGYIEQLTETFPWNQEGAAVLRGLLVYRHQFGAPLPDWASLPTPVSGSS
ncbi:MAG: hypothetical protein L3J97_01465 [Thermoplasmata archaeon]|nr:hypothetical protein [Thermoplasmata archaeon]